jgi:hypothetical protein
MLTAARRAAQARFRRFVPTSHLTIAPAEHTLKAIVVSLLTGARRRAE